MKYRYRSGTMVYEVQLDRQGDGYRVNINGVAYAVEVLDAQPGSLSLRIAEPTEAGSGGASGGPAGQNGLDPAEVASGVPDPIRPQIVYWGAEEEPPRPWSLWLSANGCTYRLERPAPRQARAAGATAAADALRAPMPAQVRDVQVTEGETVAEGQTLLLLEAMKMEIRVQAPRAGRVARLLAKEGDTVERDQVIVELAPETAGE
ncbi:MAG TPA: biotin/lipoyl-containing protein [Anaerolineae bacterium]